MQKIRSQIMLDWEDFQFLTTFGAEYRVKNHSQAVKVLIREYRSKKRWCETMKTQIEITNQEILEKKQEEKDGND